MKHNIRKPFRLVRMMLATSLFACAALAVLSVSPAFAIDPTIVKTFAPNPITVGSNTTLTFVITNPNVGYPLTGVAFTDPFPAGVITPNNPFGLTTVGCGSVFTIVPAAGGGTLNVTGVRVAAAGATCTITVNLRGLTTGIKVNTTGVVTSVEDPGSDTATDTLTVNAAPPPTPLAQAPALGNASLAILAVLFGLASAFILRRRAT